MAGGRAEFDGALKVPSLREAIVEGEEEKRSRKAWVRVKTLGCGDCAKVDGEDSSCYGGRRRHLLWRGGVRPGLGYGPL